ncbi:MAG: sel1 repeat family protein, partial [Proteobacteria bacterium]|nr:sel1 repeat family protein [Pseudomonadota bacterium]
MRKTLSSLVIALLLGWSGAVYAGDFQTGLEAYRAGDYMAALRDFRKAADQGLAPAQYVLGVMYHHGRGVAQDYAEAVKWYRRAADQGNANAQFNLGGM